MGLIYTKLRLTNLFRQNSVEIEALVDTGATFLCVTNEIAARLGFDVTEFSQQIVTFADGRQGKVPRIAPLEIAFQDRTYVTEAVVLGDEPLLGVLPMEAMDLVADPGQRKLVVNPRHPDYPVALAKYSSAFPHAWRKRKSNLINLPRSRQNHFAARNHCKRRAPNDTYPIHRIPQSVENGRIAAGGIPVFRHEAAHRERPPPDWAAFRAEKTIAEKKR
uniref:Clan AA aspartic protease, AF_0612 family n=1 Tax=Candidatus Kentrum sp. TC TaxID=2126339 RepID=A0A450ZBS0_9GAMM|nr:MAG: clan AA aspartic protease, AF_0612 family [Candidatus Kentron sp. TC]